MATLKEPNKQIPGGNQFYVADTKWNPDPYSSIDSIVKQLIKHRQGRPDLVAKHGWSLDEATVYQEVLAYQVAVCLRHGWNEYLVGGAEISAPFPPTPPRPLQKLKNVAGGVETLISWIKDGAEAVSPELAERRAEICSTCPENKPGGWETWFTVPASNAIRAALERRKAMNLHTSLDDKLFTCGVCMCPLPLKVHLPLDRILTGMPQDQQDALSPQCWIRNHDQPATPNL